MQVLVTYMVMLVPLVGAVLLLMKFGFGSGRFASGQETGPSCGCGDLALPMVPGASGYSGRNTKRTWFSFKQFRKRGPHHRFLSQQSSLQTVDSKGADAPHAVMDTVYSFTDGKHPPPRIQQQPHVRRTRHGRRHVHQAVARPHGGHRTPVQGVLRSCARLQRHQFGPGRRRAPQLLGAIRAPSADPHRRRCGHGQRRGGVQNGARERGLLPCAGKHGMLRPWLRSLYTCTPSPLQT